MAIIGGAGNPVGGSFTGPAQALEINGDFAYAYSGAITVTSGSFAKGLEFTTGNYYAVVDLQVQTLDVTGADLIYKIEMNGSVIVEQANNNPSGSGAAGTGNPLTLHIPAYTEIIISGQRGAGSDYDVYFNLTGEITRE